MYLHLCCDVKVLYKTAFLFLHPIFGYNNWLLLIIMQNQCDITWIYESAPTGLAQANFVL